MLLYSFSCFQDIYYCKYTNFVFHLEFDDERRISPVRTHSLMSNDICARIGSPATSIDVPLMTTVM